MISFLPAHMNHKICSNECRKKQAEDEKNYLITDKDGHTSNFYKLRFAIFTRDNFTCQYCGRNVQEDGIKLQADHIYPKKLGGEFIMENMITACEECNLGKRDVLLEERLIQRFKNFTSQ